MPEIITTPPEAFFFCGITEQVSEDARRRLYAWKNKRRLGYAILNQVPNVADMSVSCRREYNKIQRACGLEFVEVPSAANADIIITTAKIDGSGSVLADHELPMGNDVQLRCRLDRGEKWSDVRPVPNGTIPFGTTFLHESCHGCGLGHTNVPNSLMNPFLNIGLDDLTTWEREQLEARYGLPIAGPTPEPEPTDPPVPGSPLGVPVRHHKDIGYYIPVILYPKV